MQAQRRFSKLQPTAPAAARWTGGFWSDRWNLCRDVMVPTMGRLMCESDRVRFVGNFEVACGLVEGRHRGPKWNDGDFYKWLEAAAGILGDSHDPELDRQLDALIELIGKTQDPDGYIHTDVQIAQRAGQPIARFGNPMDFEMYNMGHLISAGIAHHRATGKQSLLGVAIKAADFLDREFADPNPEQARHGICPWHLVALTDLHRVTGQRRYLDLAVRLLNMRDLVARGDDDNQDRIPLRKQTTAHGHAVRATYLYTGAADIYSETGDQSLLTPLQTIWDDLTQRKLYITGGCGALFDGASPDGAIDQTQITRVHQAFGRNYQLPNSTAHNETCAAIGNMLWSWRMFLITGEPKYADLVEWTLYNSVLAGISLDGTAFFYTNTLRNLEPMPQELRWPRHRQRHMGCWCCPPNVLRVIARSGEFAYALGETGVYVGVYGSSTLDTELPGGRRVRLSQETDYPWDGRVRITIQSPGEFSIFLRIPEWASDATVRSNRQAPVPAQRGNFHEIRENWQAGDMIELNLPMPPRFIQANPYVEELTGQVAIARGPIVYCLETADLPAGTRIHEISINASAGLTPSAAPSLPGITQIAARGVRSDCGDWAGRLYRRREHSRREEIEFSLVPYFAWDNRGVGEMTVWMPAAG